MVQDSIGFRIVHNFKGHGEQYDGQYDTSDIIDSICCVIRRNILLVRWSPQLAVSGSREMWGSFNGSAYPQVSKHAYRVPMLLL